MFTAIILRSGMEAHWRDGLNVKSYVDQFAREIFARLLDNYGPQGWWPGASNQFQVCLGAILVQHTSWRNVEKALLSLSRGGIWSTQALHMVDINGLEELVHSAGTYRVKARTLKDFAKYLSENYNLELDEFLAQPLPNLRNELLGIRGIGKETADVIALYAGGYASFVIDSYTKRVFRRLSQDRHDLPYDNWQRVFTDGISADAQMFNEYHALLVRLAKDVCVLRSPRCLACCVRDMCMSAGMDDDMARISG